MDAAEIVGAIKGLSQADKEALAEDLANYFWASQRSRAMQDVRNQIAPRILVSGNEVNKDAAGNPIGFGNTGKSQFPVVNFVGATGSVDSNTNGVQVNVKTNGLCIDVKVDAAGGGDFTTIQAAIDHVAAVAGVLPFPYFGRAVFIYICPGDYEENIVIPNLNGANIQGLSFRTEVYGDDDLDVLQGVTIGDSTGTSGSCLIQSQSGLDPITFDGIGFRGDKNNNTVVWNGGANGSAWFKRCGFFGDFFISGAARIITFDHSIGSGVLTEDTTADTARDIHLVLNRTRFGAISLKGDRSSALTASNSSLKLFGGCSLSNTADTPALELNRTGGGSFWTLYTFGTVFPSRLLGQSSIKLVSDGNNDVGTTGAGDGYSPVQIVGNIFPNMQPNGAHVDDIIISVNSGKTLKNVVVVGNVWPANTLNGGSVNHRVSIQGAGIVDGATIAGNVWPYAAGQSSLNAGVIVESSGTLTNSAVIGNAPTDTPVTLGSGTGNNTGAPSGDTYVTVANESAILPNSRRETAGSGIALTDGGAGSTLAVALGIQTADWNQTGVFNDNLAGHMGVGGGASPTLANAVDLIIASETTADPSLNITAINGQRAIQLTADNVHTCYGLFYNALALLSTHNLTGTPGLVGVFGNAQIVTGTGTVTDGRSFDAAAAGNAGSTMTSRSGLYVRDATGAFTLTTQYGVYIPALAKGATNWAFYTVSAANFFGGQTVIGPMTAPGTPAAGNLALYNETGTQFLKAKDASGNVYNLTEHYSVEAVVDGTTASSTVPFAVMRCRDAGTITGIFSKCAENKTCGATAWVGDVRKIVLANADTDGQGTTIFTTKPTITNTHMYQDGTSGLNGTQTVAAGDWLAFYTTQAGTSVTFITLAVDIRPT